MKQLNIYIAIRSPILRDGIRRILASDSSLEVKFTTDDLDELDCLPQDEQCTFILDINLPDSNTVEFIRKLTGDYPDLVILTIGEGEKPSDIKKVIKAGASGYICKNQDSDELIKAVKRINKGDLYLSDKAIRELYNKEESTSNHKASADLTNREREILALICQELTNREIADKLSISVRTVDAHRRNILQKTGAKNTAGLVKYAIRNKIFSLSQ